MVLASALAFVVLSMFGSPFPKTRTAADTPAYQFHVALSDNAGFSVAVSPDGRRIAFDTCCSPPRIWVHDLATEATRPVRNTEGGIYPSWSPDGSHLAFAVPPGKLKIVDLQDGPAVTVYEGTGIGAASWRAQGILVPTSAGIVRVPPTGGAVERIAIEDGASPAVHRSPQWLPDGRHFIYHVTSNGHAAEYLAEVGSRHASRLVDSEYPAAFAVPSTLLFLRGTALMAQSLDVDSGRLTGTPDLIAADVAPGAINTRARFSVSATGVLAFMGARGGRPGQLTWFDRQGNEIGRIAQPDGVDYLNPAISPDGRLVAVNRMDPQTANWDIWTIDLARNLPTRVTFDDAIDSDPVWSPDGRQIVFVSNRGGHLGLYRTTVGQPPDERLLVVDDAASLIPSHWSDDGRFVIYTLWRVSSPGSDVWALPLTEGAKPQLVAHGQLTYGGRVSPDGRWIAYSSYETGSQEVYAQPFLKPGQRRQISNGSGVYPRWTTDGREIVYWAPPAGLAAAAVDVEDSTLSSASPQTILKTPVLSLIDSRTHWDMTRDGTRLLARVASGTESPSMTVVVNWPARLHR